MSRGAGLFLFDKEYDYWKTHYPDVTEYIARLSATSIHILELHDRRHRTLFVADYNPDAASNRMGRVGSVNCTDFRGKEVSYASISAGDDWWFSPGEPHCADCHLAPFVESPGGKYFPIDQPRKYTLYRYSKAHGVLACQSCHESMHGLYPVRREGPEQTVDLTSHQQVLQFSPDNQYAGPVTCAACHTVNPKGVPVQLRQTEYEADYWAAVVLIHFMREGDQIMPVAELIRKYPYRKAKEIVTKGWK
jgi:hypothetical protein